MFNINPRTLSRTLATIIDVQKISTRDSDLDRPDVLVSLDVAREGTVTATHTRLDGQFTIVVPDATGSLGDTLRVNIHQLKSALNKVDGDTASMDLGPLGAPRITREGRTLASLRRNSTAPHTPSTVKATYGPAVAHVRNGGMKTLAGVAKATDGRAGLPLLTSIAIRHRAGRVETIATDRFRIAEAHSDVDAGGRDGNPDAPVMISAGTFAALSRLNCDVDMSLSSTARSAGAHAGIGSIRLVAPTWTFDRESVDCQQPNLAELLVRDSKAVPFEYTGTVAINSSALDRAIREADTGRGAVALQWLPSPDGDGHRLVVSSGSRVGVAEAVDLCGADASTMEPFDRIVVDPVRLRGLLSGIGRRRRIELSWGYNPHNTRGVRRLRLEHTHGTAVLAAINEVEST